MSRLALEHAAISPFIFTQRLQNAGEMHEHGLPPAAIRVLPCRPDHPAFVEIALVPGGRFLVTTSLPDLIELWDLGNGSDMMPNKPVAIARLEGATVDEEEHLHTTMQPTPDGKGIRAIIPTLPSNDTK